MDHPTIIKFLTYAGRLVTTGTAAIFVILSISSTARPDPAQDSWTRISIPPEAQDNQIQAGYPMGCEITSMVYALKFGPEEWRNGYRTISGETDAQKIRTVATQFAAKPSQDAADGRPAFSEKYGTDPNDLPWMFQSLIPDSKAFSPLALIQPPRQASTTNRSQIQIFLANVTASLKKQRPVLAQLYYSDPDFSHAVVIIGTANFLSDDGSLQVSVIDPMTGLESQGVLMQKNIVLFNHEVEGITFIDHSMIDRSGTLISILLSENQ